MVGKDQVLAWNQLQPILGSYVVFIISSIESQNTPLISIILSPLQTEFILLSLS
jgi:hypothetical protein